MKNTLFNVEDDSGDLSNKDSISPGQIKDLNSFIAKRM